MTKRDILNMDLLAVALVVLCAVVAASGQNITFTIVEEESVPVTVGNVATASNLRQQVGETEFGALRYSIVSGDNGMDASFTVEETSGELYTSKVVDREILCGHVPVCLISLDIAVQSSRSAFFRKISIVVKVLDVNDNAPAFINSMFQHDINEGELLGYKLALPLATDKDSDDKNTVQYYQLTPSSLTFSLEHVRTDGKVSGLSVSITSEIDRESQDKYSFTLTAYDGGDPARSGTLSVIINVKDQNDNAPIFVRPIYETTLPENATIHSSVVHVSASDNDIGNNANVSYGFSVPTQETVSRHFTIDVLTGLITVKSPFSGLGGQVFDFKVNGIDHGNPQLFTKTRIIVSITNNVNDKPVIDVKLLFASNGAAAVPESSTIGRTAVLISATDTDEGRNGLVACRISGLYFQLQKLDSTEYRVIVARSLDREKVQVHNITVTCSDQGTPPLSSSKHFSIQVTDDNDNSPEFTQPKYFKTIDENNAFPVSLGGVKARDKDSGENGQIVYTIDDNVSGQFSIDAATGEISAVMTFDREIEPKYTFRVFATDKGKIPKTSSATVIVNIRDKNDQSPVFKNTSYVFSILENTVIGTSLGSVKAVDADLGKGGEVQYTLRGSPVNGVVPFLVTANGELLTAANIDREKMESYSFDILASDLGTPPQITSVNVKIRILDDNDNYPEISFPVPNNDSISIPHNMEPGTEIAIVQAYDLDSGLNGWLTYSIVTANQSGLFRINSNQGVISLGRAITDQDIKKYSINISVHDDGTPQRTAYTMLRVEIVYDDAESLKSSDTNMKIVIILVCITALLAIAVLTTLLAIRYIDNSRKYKDSSFSDRESAYLAPKQTSKGRSVEYNELKPGIILVTDGNKLVKKSVTFQNESKDNKRSVFATEESKYNQLRHHCGGSALVQVPPPVVPNKCRQSSSSTSQEDEVSVVDIFHQHKALVQSLRLTNKPASNRKEGEKDPDVWSDSSGDTVGADSGHGGSELDMNSCLKVTV